MAPPFLQLSTIGSHDHDLDQYDHHHHDLFNYLEPQSSFSSTTSSLSSPIFLSPAQVQGPISDHYYREPQDFQFQLLEADHIVSYGGSCDHDQTLGNEGEKGTVINLSIDPKHGADDDHRDHENRSARAENISVKWMSSKMRIMRKMTNPDQTISSHNNTTAATNDGTTARVNFSASHNFEEQKLHPSSPLGTDSSYSTNPIRVCSDCNTTKTPLWRSGPRGPKSLCNACGIRQRKARRAMAAAANSTTLAVEAAPSMIKTSKVKLKDNKTIPFKKRCHKLAISPSPRGKSKTKLRFEDFSVSSMNQNSGTDPPPPTTTTTTTTTTTFQRVFPQDEKEAAILLMALSCGLVRG